MWLKLDLFSERVSFIFSFDDMSLNDFGKVDVKSFDHALKTAVKELSNFQHKCLSAREKNPIK